MFTACDQGIGYFSVAFFAHSTFASQWLTVCFHAAEVVACLNPAAAARESINQSIYSATENNLK